MLVEEGGFVNLDRICELIEENPELWPDSVNKGAGIQPSIEHLSDAVIQWMDGNKIPSGYIKWIDEPKTVTQILWIKNSVSYFLLSDYFYG